MNDMIITLKARKIVVQRTTVSDVRTRITRYFEGRFIGK